MGRRWRDFILLNLRSDCPLSVVKRVLRSSRCRSSPACPVIIDGAIAVQRCEEGCPMFAEVFSAAVPTPKHEIPRQFLARCSASNGKQVPAKRQPARQHRQTLSDQQCGRGPFRSVYGNRTWAQVRCGCTMPTLGVCYRKRLLAQRVPKVHRVSRTI
jgi:hypothetical protein